LKIKNNQNGFSHGMILLSLCLILAIGLIGFRVYSHSQNNKTAAVIMSPSPITSSQPSSNVGLINPTTMPALANGTDNSTLNGNLSNINTSLAQENMYNSAVTSGLNDSSNQISVPTN
jgi:hypothetical protein